jgi:hypothetical protein
MESISVSRPLAIQAVLAQVANKVKAFTSASNLVHLIVDTDRMLAEELVTKVRQTLLQKEACYHPDCPFLMG